MTDIEGVVHVGRPNLDPTLAMLARETDARTLPDVLAGRRHVPRPLGAARAEGANGCRCSRRTR